MQIRGLLVSLWLAVNVDTFEGSVEVHLVRLRVRWSMAYLLPMIILLLPMHLQWHMGDLVRMIHKVLRSYILRLLVNK